ncbi:major capsid protein [Caulobacter segnis]|uniref:Coat protein n=1 Tax=Caulobacter segnis TaxID=88688 RepID=A0A2W5X6I5_9CAUL|nr:major capsid protein [Caulobacter segnis]PZR36484.1 MAG: coat protein [Caulobacter segnis]
MRYFDSQLVANSRQHANWWKELSAHRAWFHHTETAMAQVMRANGVVANSAGVLPRDAWLEMDTITRRVMRSDEGQAWMADLMPLAKAVDIGKLVHLTRVASDTNNPVVRSMSGKVPTAMDKTVYTYRGTPVPIFSDGYGREWREWNTLQSENFDALSDDQEATTAKLKRDQAKYVLDGDPNISVKGYKTYGIRTNPLSKAINVGASGNNIDLTAIATTCDAIDNFFTQKLGKLLDDNFITGAVNLYISPDMGRSFDRSYSGSSGYKNGTLLQYLLTNRRINKIEVSFELSGNEFFFFVPSAEYVRPLIGMAMNTTAQARQNPTDDYNFLVMGAMGLEIRADYNGRTAVGYSVSF